MCFNFFIFFLIYLSLQLLLELGGEFGLCHSMAVGREQARTCAKKGSVVNSCARANWSAKESGRRNEKNGIKGKRKMKKTQK